MQQQCVLFVVKMNIGSMLHCVKRIKTKEKNGKRVRNENKNISQHNNADVEEKMITQAIFNDANNYCNINKNYCTNQ